MLTVHCFDVGQGESLAIEGPAGELAIVDFFWDPDSRKEHPLARILEDRRAQGFRDVDILCITHPDIDHYAGLAAFLQKPPPPATRAIRNEHTALPNSAVSPI